MKHDLKKIVGFIVATLIVCFLLPLPLLSHEGGDHALIKYLSHVGLLVFISTVYWSEVGAYLIKARKTTDASIGSYLWTTFLLVMVSITLSSLFSLADDHYRKDVKSMNPMGLDWARFGVAIVEVFPQVYFPLGVMMYAYWGAFIYNTQNLLRRTIDNDFSPRVLLFSTVRITLSIFASVLIYFAFFDGVALVNVPKPQGDIITFAFATPGFLIVASFFAGFYPHRFLKMLYSWVYARFSQKMPGFGKYTHSSLTIIQGITLSVEDRLAEEGIESVQALATYNVDELVARLPYPKATILDWQDQAKLANFFSDEVEYAALCSLGVRTFSAMISYQESAKKTPEFLDAVDPTPIPKDRFRHFVLHGVFQ